MKDALSFISAFINPADEHNKGIRRQHQATIREYVAKIKTGWHGRTVQIGEGLGLKFRVIANSKTSSSVFVKFSYIKKHAEIPDLDFVLQTMVDPDIGIGIYAKKVRAVSSEKEYKHTARDEQVMLSMSPDSFVEDLINKFSDHQDPLNILAKKLYHDAMRHLGERHIENEVHHPEVIVPFDYAQEMLRVMKTQASVEIGEHGTLVPFKVTALKENQDVVLKLKIEGEGWPSDSLLNLYITVDDLFNAAAVRKVRVTAKSANDYSDSDDDHPVTLQPHPEHAAMELLQELVNDSTLSMVVNSMLMRAKHHMAGGTALD